MDYQNESQDDRIKVIEDNLKEKLDWKVFAVSIGIIVGLFGSLFTLYLSLKTQIETQNTQIMQELSSIKTDISWIKKIIEKSTNE